MRLGAVHLAMGVGKEELLATDGKNSMEKQVVCFSKQTGCCYFPLATAMNHYELGAFK